MTASARRNGLIVDIRRWGLRCQTVLLFHGGGFGQEWDLTAKPITKMTLRSAMAGRRMVTRVIHEHAEGLYHRFAQLFGRRVTQDHRVATAAGP